MKKRKARQKRPPPLIDADEMSRHLLAQQENAKEMVDLARKMRRLAVKMRKESERRDRRIV